MTERAKRAAEIRDARHMDPTHPPAGNKKDTKRWCRGVVGREHDAEWVSYSELNHSMGWFMRVFSGWKILRCKKCGKQLRHKYP